MIIDVVAMDIQLTLLLVLLLVNLVNVFILALVHLFYFVLILVVIVFSLEVLLFDHFLKLLHLVTVQIDAHLLGHRN